MPGRPLLIREDVEVAGKVTIRGDMEAADVKVGGKTKKLEQRLTELEARVAALEAGR